MLFWVDGFTPNEVIVWVLFIIAIVTYCLMLLFIDSQALHLKRMTSREHTTTQQAHTLTSPETIQLAHTQLQLPNSSFSQSNSHH